MLGHKCNRNEASENGVDSVMDDKIVSNKPLWVNDVKRTFDMLFDNNNNNNGSCCGSGSSKVNFEYIKDAMIDSANSSANANGNASDINKHNSSSSSSNTLTNSEYPYYTTIKKIMYAFGDTYNNNEHTVIYIHNFIKTFSSHLLTIMKECDFKKTIEHLFPSEYEKHFNYKHLKFKSSFLSNTLPPSCPDDAVTPLNTVAASIDDITTPTFILPSKSSDYTENIAFQCLRTEHMDNQQYYEYIACRQHNFLSLGKKHFITYLTTACGGVNAATELKESSNVELVAFILKEQIKKIVSESIKAKHPDKKLFVLLQPLTVDDVRYACEKEVNVVKTFMERYLSDVRLVKEFRKKGEGGAACGCGVGSGNKNVKVKRGKEGEVNVVVKRYIYVDDEEEEVFLRKYKKVSELQVMTALLILKDKYVSLRKVVGIQRKSMGMKGSSGSTKNVSVKELIKELCIENYYEYYLIRDYVSDINVEGLKPSELLGKITVLNKISKKTLAEKFVKWIGLSKEEKEEVKNEFNRMNSV